MRKTTWFSIAALSLLLAVPVFGDMPRADRGHVGASNTGALGMILVGDGNNAFPEQQPPNDCPLAQNASTGALECHDGSGNDVAFTVPFSGIPEDGQVVYFPIPFAITCADDFAGSYATADEASTGTATISIKKNGSSVGSAAYAGSETGTLTTTGGAVTFAAGDKMALVFPSTANATLANGGITFVCERT